MEMTKKTTDNNQLDIFDLIKEVSRKQAEAAEDPSTNGKASIDAAVRSLVSQALKRNRGSRYDVAARMSEILGVEISKAQLDAWSAESKENHRFPLVYAAAFCEATGDKALVRYIAKLCGGYFIEGEDALRLELGRIEEQKADLQKRERAVREFLESLGRSK
jgi:hypothetical protein